MDRPQLTRALLRDPAFAAVSGAALPAVAGHSRPVRILQFGTGALLRGFVDDIIDAANARGAFDGAIAAVGTTASGRGAALTEQDGLFTLSVQGIHNGREVDELRVISAVDCALAAGKDWDAVLALARSPALRIVVSNTTEVGLALVADDAFGPGAPASFPAKLTRVLFERHHALGGGAAPGVIVLPCELVEQNGAKLRTLVLEQAAQWSLAPAFVAWVSTHCRFCNTLVDRIVPGTPRGADAERLEARLGARDGMLTVCEPYRLFAIEGDAAVHAALGFAEGDPTVVVAPDITPFRVRKVRVLNGGHTATVTVGLLAGLETVRELVTHEALGRLVRRTVLDEIVPSLEVEGGETFARDVLDRFANPRIRHALADITLHGTAKMRVRVVPSVLAFVARHGRVPQALALGFAAHLLFLRGDVQAQWAAAGRAVPLDGDGAALREAWLAVRAGSDADREAFVRRVCSDLALWGTDLAAVDGWAPAVAAHLAQLMHHGALAAVNALLATESGV